MSTCMVYNYCVYRSTVSARLCLVVPFCFICEIVIPMLFERIKWWWWWWWWVVFSEKRKNCSQNAQVLPFQAVITLEWLQLPKIHYQMIPYGMSSFHFTIRFIAVFPLTVCSVPERFLPKLQISVTLNDFERRNGPNFALFHRIRVRCGRTTIVSFTPVSKSTFDSLWPY